MNYNAHYDIIPPEFIPNFYDIIPPTIDTSVSRDLQYIQDVRMQASIERFASFESSMDIPEWNSESYSDDATVLYDDEEYVFDKCGEIPGYEYDCSEFCELDTIVPEYEDYFLPDEEGKEEKMDISAIDYHLDPDYWEELRIERMMDRFQERDRY